MFCRKNVFKNFIRRFSVKNTTWKLKEKTDIPEFQLTASRLEHKSGSELLHLHRADPNATFSVGFRTVPLNSTGLPHILEHTVLCGSERYPCRDPFFLMLNRSLATYMNASTAPDFTVYPFSSQNAQDCRNLQSVYLDAVFKPKLCAEDFRQEGWRLEHEDPHDPSTPIIIKGVVFNEMKGVFSDNQTLYTEALLNGILPSHTYGVCSGGLPIEIPKLRHEDLVNFHKNHYTAANARFFIYGNQPIEEYLEAIEPYLKPGSAVAPVPSEPRWSKPRRQHIICRPDPMAADPDKQACISTSFLCCDIQNIQETFNLQVLSELLVSGPNAAFYKSLVEPGIGAGLAPSTGYESQTRDTFFSVGLQGVHPKDFDKIEQIIQNTFKEVAEVGFPPERVEAILHGIELGVKHQNANFGLSILYGIASLWNHDGDILSALGVEKQVAQIRQNLKKDPQFLQKKVKEHFVNNPHRFTLTMAPDDTFELKQKQSEDELLNEKLSKLTENDKKRIYEEGLELLERRKLDNKNVLPTLKIEDIPKSIEKTKTIQKNNSVMIFPQPTNGVTYFRGLLTTENLSPDLQKYLPVYAYVSTKMGTKDKTFRELDQAIESCTGGLGVSCHTTEGIRKPSYEQSLLFGSHCLDRNIEPMFELWGEVLQKCDLDDEARFETLIKSLAANLVNSVTASGHHYAMLGASSLISEASALKETQSGLNFINLLKNLAGGNFKNGLEKVREIQKNLSSASLRCSINALPGTNLKPFDSFLERLGLDSKECCLKNSKILNDSFIGRFHVLPFDVSYASQATLTVPYTHADFAPLRILSRLLTSKYLHPEVREKGGAYGGGATQSGSGIFVFYSYRDPTPSNSLKIFDGSLEWLQKNMPKNSDIDEAKLGVFQSVDAPISPGQRGAHLFLHGISDECFEEYRKRLLGVTADDLIRVADLYLKNPSGRCVLGPKNVEITENSKYVWKLIE